MNFKFGGIRVVKVGDYYETNDHFPLYNDTDTDVWDTLLCGERLKIAEQIKLKLWEEKNKVKVRWVTCRLPTFFIPLYQLNN